MCDPQDGPGGGSAQVRRPPALPIHGQDAPDARRCDAARNRAVLLARAEAIIAVHGAAGLTMDGLARAAGMGKGTVFRHFGSRSGLLNALLDHAEAEFQRAVIFGPPPLGPGAAPAERLKAYGRAVVERFTAAGELQLAAFADTPTPYRIPAFRFAHQHLAMLLARAGCAGDTGLLAYTLLAAVEPPALAFQLHSLSLPPDRVVAHWDFLLDAVLG